MQFSYFLINPIILDLRFRTQRINRIKHIDDTSTIALNLGTAIAVTLQSWSFEIGH